MQKLFAGGFQINLQGNYQTAMAHCGTGFATDAAGVYFNPGTLSFLKFNSATAGVNLIFHDTEYLEADPGNYTARTQNTIGTPLNFYGNFKFKKVKNLSAGVGIYTPFGSRVKYDDDWKGQFLLREIDLKTFFIQPTLSYQLTNKIGVGVGFVYSTGSLKLRKALPVQDANGIYGEGELKGKANGVGFNAGIYFEANAKLSLGISYRSAVKVKVTDGDAKFTVPLSLEKYFPATSFTTQITLPSTTTFGIAYHHNKKLTLAFECNYVGWKSYDTLSFDFKENTEKLADIHSPRQYANSFIYRLGVQYKCKHDISLRAGVYFDEAPVNAGYLTPETPDANKISFTCGAGFKLIKNLHCDISFLYTEAKQRTDTNIETAFAGTWKSKAWVPGFNITYQF